MFVVYVIPVAISLVLHIYLISTKNIWFFLGSKKRQKFLAQSEDHFILDKMLEILPWDNENYLKVICSDYMLKKSVVIEYLRLKSFSINYEGSVLALGDDQEATLIKLKELIFKIEKNTILNFQFKILTTNIRGSLN